MMLRKFNVPSILHLHGGTNASIIKYFNFSTAAEKSTADNVKDDSEIAEEPKFSEDEIAKIRNCSKLKGKHYRRIHRIPHTESPDYMCFYQDKPQLRYQRTDIGRNGFNSSFDPAICFTTKEEMEDLIEYEKVAFDVPILEFRKKELEKIEEKKVARKQKEEHALSMLKTMPSWKERIINKKKEKEEVVLKTVAERARLLEDVRRFFGYTIDPNDEKFQLMLAHKEKEIEKKKRIEKKKKREEMFMSKLASLEVNND